MYKSKIAENILAEHLINNGAVSFLTERPMRLKSGLITPIYVDNRRLTAVPEAWRDILETMATKVVELGLEFDIVAGVEGAGVTEIQDGTFAKNWILENQVGRQDLRQQEPRRRLRHRRQARPPHRGPHLHRPLAPLRRRRPQG